MIDKFIPAQNSARKHLSWISDQLWHLILKAQTSLINIQLANVTTETLVCSWLNCTIKVSTKSDPYTEKEKIQNTSLTKNIKSSKISNKTYLVFNKYNNQPQNLRTALALRILLFGQS